MIPDKIKIGDKDYKVAVDDDIADDSRDGEIRFRKAEIAVISRLETQVMKEVLVHESIHGMLEFMGELDINRDEEKVIRITNGLLMLIKDNPELFK